MYWFPMWYIKEEQIKDNFNIKAPSVKKKRKKKKRKRKGDKSHRNCEILSMGLVKTLLPVCGGSPLIRLKSVL